MRTIRALWGASHPGPSVVVTVLAVALGIAAGLEPWRVVLLGAAVFCGQLSVGISNDAIDHERDRSVGRTDKPLVRGEVSARTAWIAAIASVAAALVLSAPLGAGMLAAHAIALASAWSYNAGLKSTPVSIVPFVVSFGVFPSLATLSADPPALAAWWAWVAGGALGAAVHLTNVLPDLEDDRRTGVRGFAHRLGARPAAALAGIAVLIGAGAVLWGAVDAGPLGAVAWILFAVVAALALATVVRVIVRPPDRIVFRLVMAAALLLAVQLVATPGTLAS
ncbi:UbiA family prenyltransferase [Microbacterium sp. zg.Y1090]|uniref:UbiA family prenyltransferase n=1 Tax=Microbacterium wangruii TaxID=3049073 RepID=UPI00214DAE7A|nr:MULTISPECIES: UbiA family prenyltransferase [unclassified Microbacterium]MCR2819501.1 UbiA family prenyltransferase [Microbacterium sp. zg.Y1090]MDL5487355.1 UbiA family prenyltransferase [Microbacterium sp. zg-Y1211]WIM28473.1 UbiA family prenyltransferase [Microbacterium sp. zg-Y1090]